MIHRRVHPGAQHPADLRRGFVVFVAGLSLLAMVCAGLSGCGHEEPAEPGDDHREQVAAATADRYDPALASEPQAPTAEAISFNTPALEKPTEPLPKDASCITPGCHITLVDAKHVHGPVAVADCQSCHGQDVGGHQYPLKRPGNQTCMFCHPVVGAREHEHEAISASGCVACHDPHRSDTNFLLAESSIELTCASCHDTPLKKHAHGPFAAGQCTVCHQPHEANASNLLRSGDQPEHCYGCHSEIDLRVGNSPFVHEPLKEGCTACHDAHTSDFPFQLAAPITQSCLDCHEQMAKRVRDEPVSHDALFIADGCANCHDPHASADPNLLRDRADHLCLACHEDPVEASDGRTIVGMKPTLNRRFLHGPVRAGDCAACHSVHGGQNARLLLEKFPDTFYASFELSSYALCFSCHSPDLVMTENTAELTGFRDGDTNLHYTHVHRDKKGRTCKTCHDIHGSDLPQHMASEVPFEGSRWSMPINFTKVQGGGSCAPGCHEPKTYRRGPATTPAPPLPTQPDDASITGEPS